MLLFMHIITYGYCKIINKFKYQLIYNGEYIMQVRNRFL